MSADLRLLPHPAMAGAEAAEAGTDGGGVMRYEVMEECLRCSCIW
jgi:hypothetical protein